MLAPKRRRAMTARYDSASPEAKLPRPSGTDNAARLARTLRFRFRDIGLLRIALTHRSILQDASNAGIRGRASSFTNERLEFLGDAVLGAVAAEYLYYLDPLADE